jgi:hypothetical protein
MNINEQILDTYMVFLAKNGYTKDVGENLPGCSIWDIFKK